MDGLEIFKQLNAIELKTKYVEAIIIEYNGRKKNPANRLSLGKLYKNKRSNKDELPDDLLFGNDTST